MRRRAHEIRRNLQNPTMDAAMRTITHAEYTRGPLTPPDPRDTAMRHALWQAFTRPHACRVEVLDDALRAYRATARG